MDNLKKNDIVILNVTDISAEGQGVGRYNGAVVFVPFTVPGDVIKAKIVKVNKNHAYAKVYSISEPSPDRVENDCTAFGKCGGCDYRHIRYEAELNIKLDIASAALRRIGGTEEGPDGIVPSPFTARYRNKAILPFAGEPGHVRLGFFVPRSHRLVELGDCVLCPEEFTGIQRTALDFINTRGITAYDEATGSGLLRFLYLRRAERTSEIMVCFVINGSAIPGEHELAALLSHNFLNVTGVLINTHKSPGNANMGDAWRVLRGRDYVKDRICGLSMRISAPAFYQVNTAAAEKLYFTALDMLEPIKGERIADLFCGAGAIGLIFAKHRPDINVTGVEIEKRAVLNARENACVNNIGNINFIRADAGQPDAIANCLSYGFSTIIVDPPRKGLEHSTALAIATATPRRIEYISCDPATLSRDVRFFSQNGYVVVRARTVDMFPRTRHIETVVVMERKGILTLKDAIQGGK